MLPPAVIRLVLSAAALFLLLTPSVLLAQEAPPDPLHGSACCGYTVFGYKFFDKDGDGVMNGTDYGLSGWGIVASDTTGVPADTAYTDSTGYWEMFTPLWCGNQVVLSEILVPGWSQSYPGGGGTHQFLGIGCGAVLGPFDFGNTDPPCADFTRTYTTDADFLEGTLDGVITNSDQLELAPTGTTFEFAWIANTGEGTVSKVSTVTGNEVARYYTGPADTYGEHWYLNPSRTAVDADGNCWVANRNPGGVASITQILANGGDDRNSNATIETSFDASANGEIEPGEMLDWGDDERVVRHYLIGSGPPDDLARGLAFDKTGFLWVALHNSLRVVKLDPNLPMSIYSPDMPPSAPPELISISLAGIGLAPYGLALSPNGKFYTCYGEKAAEIDPGLASGGTAAGPAVTQYIQHPGDNNYGLVVDSDCIVWLAKSWSTDAITGYGAIRWDPSVGVGDPSLGWAPTAAGAPGYGRGITVDYDGNIWMVANDDPVYNVVKYDNTGSWLGNYPTGLIGTVGIGAGPDGDMIVVGTSSNAWAKIDKDTGAIIAMPGPQLTGVAPYTYSDFTGSMSNIVALQQGFWTVTTDGGSSGLSWYLVDWTDTTPPGTDVLVEARTAFTLGSLATEPWSVIYPPGPLGSSMPGRYIETRVRLTRDQDGCGSPFVTPILYDLTVAAECDSCYLVSCPPDTVVICESEAGSVVNFVAPVPNHDCDPTWVTTCTPPSGSLFPVGSTTVLCQSVNASNDTLACTFQITVTGDCITEVTGACCFDNAVCEDLPEGECHDLGGVYLGNGTDCATEDCGVDCVRPPLGLTAWFPLDNAPGGITPNLAHPPSGGTVSGPTPNAGAYVNGSYTFDGINDFIQAPDNATLDLGTGDLTIDFWIQTSVVQGNAAILDKRQSSPIRGYRMFLQNGYPALTLADGSGQSTWALTAANGGAAAFVADGSWHLVAVTVDRSSTSGGQFYVDGAPVGTTFDPTPRNGSLNSTAALVLGRNYDILGTGGYLLGGLDEVEIFHNVVSALDIDAVYAAGPAGKCREVCYASTRSVCCDGEANSYITICNYDVVPHLYSYGLTPSTDPGCSGLGVTAFDPPSGTVTVGPGQCLTIPIDIICPTDMAPGLESCFQALVYNHDTGATFGCLGSVRRPAWWCIKWEVAAVELKGIQPVLPGNTVPFNLFVKHLPVLNPTPVDFTYEIHPVEPDGRTPSPSLSLDGLPPGEPVVRTVKVPPEGIDLPFDLEFSQHEALSFQRIVLKTDEDMDGNVEEVAEFAVRSDAGSTTGIDDHRIDDPILENQRPFLALPNPFNSSGAIRFRVEGDAPGLVSLQLFDLRGREIRRFFRKRVMEPGIHELVWDGRDGYGIAMPSGVYFLRLEAPGVKETVKVALIR